VWAGWLSGYGVAVVDIMRDLGNHVQNVVFEAGVEPNTHAHISR
jgi:hypothetical protein